MKRATNNPRNQRLSTTKQRKQQHLLDVKVRSNKHRQQRNRRVLLALCKVVVFSSVIAGIYYGGRECMNRLLWQNPDYNLANIEIHSDGTLTRDQILTASKLREGGNIFNVNIDDARDRLGMLPQVEHAEIERMLPDKISITINERRPVAWIMAKSSEDPTASDDAFLIDRKAALIKTKKLLPEYFHLPVISGFATDNLEAGQTVNAVEVKAALDLIRMNGDSTRFQIRSIDISKGYCLIVSNQNHKRFTFGFDKLDLQLDAVAQLLDYAESKNKIIQTANVMVQRNMPVTFAGPSDDLGADDAVAEAPEKSKTKKAAVVAKKSDPENSVRPKSKVTPMPVKKAQPLDSHSKRNG
jgi:cell division protein FtsQ